MPLRKKSDPDKAGKQDKKSSQSGTLSKKRSLPTPPSPQASSHKNSDVQLDPAVKVLTEYEVTTDAFSTDVAQPPSKQSPHLPLLKKKNQGKPGKQDKKSAQPGMASNKRDLPATPSPHKNSDVQIDSAVHAPFEYGVTSDAVSANVAQPPVVEHSNYPPAANFAPTRKDAVFTRPDIYEADLPRTAAPQLPDKQRSVDEMPGWWPEPQPEWQPERPPVLRVEPTPEQVEQQQQQQARVQPIVPIFPGAHSNAFMQELKMKLPPKIPGECTKREQPSQPERDMSPSESMLRRWSSSTESSSIQSHTTEGYPASTFAEGPGDASKRSPIPTPSPTSPREAWGQGGALRPPTADGFQVPASPDSPGNASKFQPTSTPSPTSPQEGWSQGGASKSPTFLDFPAPYLPERTDGAGNVQPTSTSCPTSPREGHGPTVALKSPPLRDVPAPRLPERPGDAGHVQPISVPSSYSWREGCGQGRALTSPRVRDVPAPTLPERPVDACKLRPISMPCSSSPREALGRAGFFMSPPVRDVPAPTLPERPVDACKLRPISMPCSSSPREALGRAGFFMQAWVIVDEPTFLTANGNMPALKQGEVLRWINFDENVLSGITELVEHTFIDCERNNGEVVVLPSECARVLRDKLEIANVLTRRPRAELIEDYISQSPRELHLKAGEVVYLHQRRAGNFFYASNKLGQKCTIPASALNVLVPCEP